MSLPRPCSSCRACVCSLPPPWLPPGRTSSSSTGRGAGPGPPQASPRPAAAPRPPTFHLQEPLVPLASGPRRHGFPLPAAPRRAEEAAERRRAGGRYPPSARYGPLPPPAPAARSHLVRGESGPRWGRGEPPPGTGGVCRGCACCAVRLPCGWDRCARFPCGSGGGLNAAGCGVREPLALGSGWCEKTGKDPLGRRSRTLYCAGEAAITWWIFLLGFVVLDPFFM